MARASVRWVGVGVVVVAGVVWLVVDRDAPRRVDSELAAAVLPAIDVESERGPWPGLPSTTRPELGPRWFSVEHVIETRRPGDEVRVGMAALCEEYARDGSTLLTGSGERAAKVVDLVGRGSRLPGHRGRHGAGRAHPGLVPVARVHRGGGLGHSKEHSAYRRSSSGISPDLEPPRR
jgi:hypothetical protein